MDQPYISQSSDRLVLDLDPSDPLYLKRGCHLYLSICATRPSWTQEFRLEKNGVIVSLKMNLPLDASISNERKNEVVVWRFNKRPNQRWKLTSEGYLENVHFPKHVLVAVGGVKKGARIELRSLAEMIKSVPEDWYIKWKYAPNYLQIDNGYSIDESVTEEISIAKAFEKIQIMTKGSDVSLLERLPLDMIKLLFHLLEPADFGRLGRVSKGVRGLVSNEDFWRALYFSKFDMTLYDRRTVTSWKAAFGHEFTIDRNIRNGNAIMQLGSSFSAGNRRELLYSNMNLIVSCKDVSWGSWGPPDHFLGSEDYDLKTMTKVNKAGLLNTTYRSAIFVGQYIIGATGRGRAPYQISKKHMGQEPTFLKCRLNTFLEKLGGAALTSIAKNELHNSVHQYQVALVDRRSKSVHVLDLQHDVVEYKFRYEDTTDSVYILSFYEDYIILRIASDMYFLYKKETKLRSWKPNRNMYCKLTSKYVITLEFLDVCVRTIKTDEVVSTFKLPEYITYAVDSTKLFLQTKEEGIFVYELRTGQHLSTFSTSLVASSLYAEDGKLVAFNDYWYFLVHFDTPTKLITIVKLPLGEFPPPVEVEIKSSDLHRVIPTTFGCEPHQTYSWLLTTSKSDRIFMFSKRNGETNDTALKILSKVGNNAMKNGAIMLYDTKPGKYYTPNEYLGGPLAIPKGEVIFYRERRDEKQQRWVPAKCTAKHCVKLL